ncbi:MAG: ABC transporter ATP-binding protein [Alphaproteobacteria bacterium]|nr:ABC transporter ATP-binding protein [Alphaproteobacteria bacterium]
MSQPVALELDSLGHAYANVTAVDSFSLSVMQGEVVCLLGPSGCGKTTVLRLAAGLERLQQGRIVIDGRLVAGPGVHVPPEDRGVGLVFQEFALFPHLTVAENVAFGLTGTPEPARRARVDEVLRRVGVADLAARYPHALSGGQQQRVALARALAPQPPLVLLDEPFSGLDARLRDQVRDETLHILKQSGQTTLLVTHDAEEAMFMADRIAVMCEGRNVQTDRPDTLYSHPVDAFVTEFFSDVNRLTGTVEGGYVATPFGRLPAAGMEEGAEAEVLIRPEALKLSPSGGAGPSDGAGEARVLASRMLGRSSLIHLCTCRQTGDELHLHARVPGRFLPVEDEVLRVHLDQAQAFVFPIAAQNRKAARPV